jgi:hypothetical protein
MKSFSLFLIAVLFITSCTSCKEDDCNAGSGGGLNVAAKMIHHTREIKGCTVYVKYNTQDFPGEAASNYDITFKANDTTSIAYLRGLNCGDYYIYAVGIDSLLTPPNNVVKGGIPFSTAQKVGTQSINLYVTEGD